MSWLRLQPFPERGQQSLWSSKLCSLASISWSQSAILAWYIRYSSRVWVNSTMCSMRQHLHHPGELGGFDRHRLLTSVVLESSVAVAVESQGDTPLTDQALKEHQVAQGVLSSAEYGLGHCAGGVVHGDEQHQLGSPFLRPRMLAAVNLCQHLLLGHAPAPEAVPRGLPMPALTRMRRTVGGLGSMPSRSRSSSVRWV